MALTAITITCDRDGIEVAGNPTGAILPEGWLILSVGGNGVAPSSIHLCPGCTEMFTTMMVAGGKGFKLTPGPLYIPPLPPAPPAPPPVTP